MAEFKIGDFVEIEGKCTDTSTDKKYVGCQYSSYTDFFDDYEKYKHLKNKFIEDMSIQNGIYEVIGVEDHSEYDETIYVVERNNQVYLINNDLQEMTLYK